MQFLRADVQFLRADARFLRPAVHVCDRGTVGHHRAHGVQATGTERRRAVGGRDPAGRAYSRSTAVRRDVGRRVSMPRDRPARWTADLGRARAVDGRAGGGGGRLRTRRSMRSTSTLGFTATASTARRPRRAGAHRNPGSAVDYRVADLLALPAEWDRSSTSWSRSRPAGAAGPAARAGRERGHGLAPTAAPARRRVPVRRLRRRRGRPAVPAGPALTDSLARGRLHADAWKRSTTRAGGRSPPLTARARISARKQPSRGRTARAHPRRDGRDGGHRVGDGESGLA